MARKFLLPLMAVIIIAAMVIPGCGPTEPTAEQVELTLLVRTEDERQEIGEYLASVLEDLGFIANIQYGLSGELSPIWFGDPNLGLWHVYTGGWISTVISRDDGEDFGLFYTDLPGWGPLWAAYGHDQPFFTEAEKLWNNDFTTMAERRDLFDVCLSGSMEDSARVFLVTQEAYTPFQTGINFAADASGGLLGSWMWGLTMHFYDGGGVPVPGGTMRIATTDLLVEPWNPVNGSNWAYDMFPMRATGDMGHHPDPTTGLRRPGRIEKADVTVVTGLPVEVTYTDWCTLTFEDEIIVPLDAWADWDAVGQDFETVLDRFGSGNTTALRKSVVYYPTGTFGVPLHDGSTLSLADFLMYAILEFDIAKADSGIYDPSEVSGFEAFLSMFKGVEFDTGVSGYDLVVTTYSDSWALDAELAATTWFPTYDQGPGMWHTIAMAIKGEEEGKLAFSNTKATEGGASVFWTNFVSGDSLTELKVQLADVIGGGSTYAPYKDFMVAEYTGRGLGDFTTEMTTRYGLLDTWVTAHNHFWVASGPMYLDTLTTTPKSLVLTRFTAYPDDADKWVFLMGLPDTGLSRMGAWLDTANLEIETSSAAAISRLQADDIDVFVFSMGDPGLFVTVQDDPTLDYITAVGTFNEFTFNPAGPFFSETGELNPFALPAVREAINWAVDRDYIVGTIMGGLGIPRYTALNTHFADGGFRYPDLVAALEAEYAYDFAAADAAIETAMLAISGVTRDAGKYYYLAP